MPVDQSVIRHDPVGIAGTKMVYKYQPVTGRLDADGKAWVELPDEFIDKELKVIIDLPQDWSQIWMNLFAGLQLLGGAATLSVACAMEVGTMGVSTLVSLALVAWSADQMYAGANTLLIQQQTGTQAAALFEWAGMPPEYSELAAGMLPISIAMVKGVATSVVNNPAIRPVTINAVRHGDKLVNRSITFIGQKIKHRYVFRRKAGQQPAVANTLKEVKTILTPEIKAKILLGQRIDNSNRIIGGHSPVINNINSNYAVETIKINPDGTKLVQYTTQFTDGNLSKLKKSTLFPDSWSDKDIIDSVKKISNSPPIGNRISTGETLHRGTINGIEIDVIKKGNDITAGYPVGGKPTLGFNLIE